MSRLIFFKIVLSVVIFTGFTTKMMAQGKVEGHLYSSSTKEKIGGATISLVTTKDSTKRLCPAG
jgi:hypothetical protein